LPTKEEYERVFNQLLGTNIKWSKLSKEELVELATIFNHPEILLEKRGVKQKAEKQAIRERFIEAGADLLFELAENWEGPIARLLRRLKQIEEPASKKD